MPSIPHVLVVDDDNDLGSTIVAELTSTGAFTAETTTSLRGAERALHAPQNGIDALLLDVQLPDGDGRQLCAQLRDEGRTLPVLLVSGLDGEDDVVRGLDLGADAYLRKPFALAELVARLHHLLPR